MNNYLNPTQMKTAADSICVGTALAITNGWLQIAVAIVTFIWVCIRVWESKLVQAWLPEHLKLRKD